MKFTCRKLNPVRDTRQFPTISKDINPPHIKMLSHIWLGFDQLFLPLFYYILCQNFM